MSATLQALRELTEACEEIASSGPGTPSFKLSVDRFHKAVAAAREILAREQPEDQVVFPNGIHAICVDHDDKSVSVILKEEWHLFTISSDSGLAVQVETKNLGDKDYPCTAKITVRRAQPGPTVDDPAGLMRLRDVAKEAKRS